MMTAGFNMPAVDLDFGDHAPSLSTSTVVPSGGLFKHTEHAGYRNVEYSTPGTSTSPSGFVFKPFILRSTGFSVDRAPDSIIWARKSAHAGLREAKSD